MYFNCWNLQLQRLVCMRRLLEITFLGFLDSLVLESLDSWNPKFLDAWIPTCLRSYIPGLREFWYNLRLQSSSFYFGNVATPKKQTFRLELGTTDVNNLEICTRRAGDCRFWRSDRNAILACAQEETGSVKRATMCAENGSMNRRTREWAPKAQQCAPRHVRRLTPTALRLLWNHQNVMRHLHNF